MSLLSPTPVRRPTYAGDRLNLSELAGTTRHCRHNPRARAVFEHELGCPTGRCVVQFDDANVAVHPEIDP